jgi:hypothetical protein
MPRLSRVTLIVVVALAAALVFTLYLNRSQYGLVKKDEIAVKVMQSEGRLWARQIQRVLQRYFNEVGSYPDWDLFQSLLMGSRKGHPQYYAFGIAQNNQTVQDICPDCHLQLDSFKIAVFGNLDGDSGLDLWIITPDGAEHVLNDLEAQ